MPIVASPEDYATIDKVYYENFNHLEELVSEIVNTVLPKIERKGSLLDIGAGSGFLAFQLSQYFSELAVVEPNHEFVKEYPKDKFKVYSIPFENFLLPHPYDFVLCTHMLYHVKLKDLSGFLEKMYQSMSPGGKTLITLSAPRGPFHEQALRLNPNYLNSGHVLETLDKLKIAHETRPVKIALKTRSLQDMHTLCRFFFIEDCFTTETLNNLSHARTREIEADITQFVKSCRTGPSTYEMIFDEDRILL